jgi:hypothetical protein
LDVTPIGTTTGTATTLIDTPVIQSATDWQPHHRWTVVNYNLLGKLQTELGGQHSRVVVDEAHYIKSESARSRHVHRVLRSAADPSADDPRPSIC